VNAGLMGVRARAVYWQKRIELEKSAAKKRQLEMFGWADLTMIVTREGASLFRQTKQGQAQWESLIRNATLPVKKAKRSR
jgi:hypothetical protein